MVVAARSHGGLDLPQLAVFAHRLNAAIAVTGQAFKTRFTPYAVEGCKAMLVTAWPLRLPGGSWPHGVHAAEFYCRLPARRRDHLLARES